MYISENNHPAMPDLINGLTHLQHFDLKRLELAVEHLTVEDMKAMILEQRRALHFSTNIYAQLLFGENDVQSELEFFTGHPEEYDPTNLE